MQTPASTQQLVLKLRAVHPVWGGRKLRRRLQDLGHRPLPSASTITEILRRHGQIDSAEADKHRAWQRFEHDAPNRLWQMDFKGHFALEQGRCHPLTVLDDHSRFSLGLEACGDEREATVKQRLTALFRRYGMPERLLADNGSPWGGRGQADWTSLGVWLIQLGVRLSHGRPHHPQTQGKQERFHRTLRAEAIGRRRFRDLAACQSRFNEWRQVYNFERPHEALGLATPASRYQASRRCFPETLAAFEYAPGDILRKVQTGGWISFRGCEWRIGKAFARQLVALRPTSTDGLFEAFFCHQQIAALNLTAEQRSVA
jgi:transposase InsO family protein